MGQTFQHPFLPIPLAPNPYLCQNHMKKLLMNLINTHLTHTYMKLTLPETIINTLQILPHLIHLTAL